MLEKIREGSQGLAAKIILGMIILSFLMTGIGSYLYSEQDKVLAEVNGSEIKLSEFNSVYQSQLKEVKLRYGKFFEMIAADEAYQSKMKNDVLQGLIDKKLLLQYIDQNRLRASEKEVSSKIVATGFRRPDFSKQAYKALRQAGIDQASFRNDIRKNIAQQQLLDGIRETNFSMKFDF